MITSFGDLDGKIVYIDNLSKQPINHIRNIVKEEEPPEVDDGENNGKKSGGSIKPNTVSPIRYVFNEDLTKNNYIYLKNQFPTPDEVGRKLTGEYKVFDFKLEFDKKSLGAVYDITLDKMDGSDIEDSWVKVYLESDGKALNQSIRDNGRIKTFNDYPIYNNKDNEILLYQSKVTSSDISKGYMDFKLRMWISEDVKIENEEYEEYNAKTIIARVNVYAMGN